MKKNIIPLIVIALIALVIVFAGVYAVLDLHQGNTKMETAADRMADEAMVRIVVDDFGRKLKEVSLLGPTAADDIKKNYEGLVDPALLEKWASDPAQALGRTVSSPWPDRIEIGEIKQSGAGAYDVSGKIVEVTSVEEAQGGAAAERPVELAIKKPGNIWLITGATVGDYEKPGWKTVNNSAQGVSFQYPEKLSVEYIDAHTWPPQISVVEGQKLNCQETDQASSLPQRTRRNTINGRDYCISAQTGAAAGSVYTDYSYAAVLNNKIVTLTFTLRYPNCLNYDDPKKTECQKEREAFDLDGLVGEMSKTVIFN